MSESQEQQALIKAANLQPWGDLLFAIPNGGLRNKIVASTLKKEGVRAGVPDLFLAVPTTRAHGLFVEMKFGKNKLTKNQEYYFDRFTNMGYRCVTCYNWTDAFKTIECYVSKAIK